MQVLQEVFSLPDFFERLRGAPRRALLLDYDGTLAPFRLDPAEAAPYPGVPEALDAIMEEARTNVVIVSGRSTRDLVSRLHLKRPPEIWGSHGFEQLKPNGDYAVHPMDERALYLLAEADSWERDIQRLGGRTEQKPGSFAIHWRGLTATQMAQIRDLVRERWQWMQFQRSGDLHWHEFDGGIELRVSGRNKGDVVRALLEEAGSHAVAAYLGDDRTDEDAFRAIKGRGLAVLVRPEYRLTAADIWIQQPEELLAFLADWLAACEVRP